jgi:cyclophilin family peptidyl-prolyl cis-trans isomerase
MRVLAPLFVLGLVACSTETVVLHQPPDSSASDTSDPDTLVADAAPPEYCPNGYTLTPFSTATATTHTYAHAEQVIDPTKDYVAVLETDAGRIVWHFRSTTAPVATNSFVFLALRHYFDGIAFHRVIAGFVAQGGDPNTLQSDRKTWGTGGPGYAFADEVTPPPSYTAATVAMANNGANTNGSQFFITLADLSGKLSPNYTLFADVIEGTAVLPTIALSTGVQGSTPPATPTLMTDVHICQK